MTLQIPLITGAQFTAAITRAFLEPSNDQFPFNVPLSFGAISNLFVDTGSYSPNNDSSTIRSWASQALAPCFLFFQCDLQVNLKVTWSGSQVITDIPVNKFFAATLAPPIAGSYITGVILDGQTSQNYPMAQSTAANYTLVTGQAVVT